METTITVRRYRPVDEPLDLAPLFARRPGAHPERIVAVTGGETTDGTATVSLTYANGWTIRASVRIDEYSERHIRRTLAPDRDAATLDTPADDVSVAALHLLIGDIGHLILDPTYLDD
jgi:hypothetical protein